MSTATAQVISLDDSRRVQRPTVDVSLSALVTSGDEKTGLVTVSSDPKAIERIKSYLADPDAASRGN